MTDPTGSTSRIGKHREAFANAPARRFSRNRITGRRDEPRCSTQFSDRRSACADHERSCATSSIRTGPSQVSSDVGEASMRSVGSSPLPVGATTRNPRPAALNRQERPPSRSPSRDADIPRPRRALRLDLVQLRRTLGAGQRAGLAATPLEKSSLLLPALRGLQALEWTTGHSRERQAHNLGR
jgi:hypothetical protein